MRLRLVAETDASQGGDKNWRLLERGELTLGRDPSCHWVLPDPARTVSKVHCRIRRDATGFTVTDESTNGMSVDRRDLAQGETVRLAKGSVISFCGQRFRAEITGEVEPDWTDPDASFAPSDDAPSITAILSDVSPAGATATGVLPGRGSDDGWLAMLDGGSPGQEGQAARASRPTIGWREPMSLGITGSNHLPDDWDTEAATSTRAEHVVATSTRMRVPRPPGAEPLPTQSFSAMPNGPTAADALDAFLGAMGGGMPASGDPLAVLAEAGRAFRDLRETVGSMSRAMAEFREDMGAAPSPPNLMEAERLAQELRALFAAVRSLLVEVDALEPGNLEMRVRVSDTAPTGLAGRLPLPGRSDRAALALLRTLYAGERGAGPRGRFADRLREGGADHPGDPDGDEFVELSADRPRRGEA